MSCRSESGPGAGSGSRHEGEEAPGCSRCEEEESGSRCLAAEGPGCSRRSLQNRQAGEGHRNLDGLEESW